MIDPLLQLVGRRLREGSAARNWTRRDLAERSGVSVRFLVQLEAGRANISVRRLADLARALDRSPADLLDEHDETVPQVIALLGLRGAGKTTIGRRLARRLRVPFVELDRRIEQAADLSLAELFSLHGEEYYRRLERDTLVDVLAERRPMVLAVEGKDLAERHVRGFLDAAIELDEADVQLARELFADRRLAGAAQAKQRDHPALPLPVVAEQIGGGAGNQ